MPLTRRTFVAGTAAALAAPWIARPAHAAIAGGPLPIPTLIEAGEDATTTLQTGAGLADILDGARTPVWGYAGTFPGPVLRFTRGRNARMVVANRLDFPVTCHWHGLHVPSTVDGGPQLEIAPGADWPAELPVDQPAATLWYHSHVHGVTAEHVYGGMAGMIIVDDPDATDDLPNTYGVDDLPIVIQDRAFQQDGSLYYLKMGPALMHGFRADNVLVNGAISPTADVPAGLVRLRLLNGSNARIYHLRFSDNRTFHQIASDGGLLPAPRPLTALTLAPAERVELLVDFADGEAVTLLSGPDTNTPMGGMGGMMGGALPGPPPQSEVGQEFEFDVMRFAPDRARPTRLTTVPASFASAPKPDFGEPVRRRKFVLNMHAGQGGAMGGMGGGVMGMMSINDVAYDPGRVDIDLRMGETELWEVFADEMAHPFHVHGTAFQVLHNGDVAVPYEETGLKDVVLVDARAEILVRVDHPATPDIPYMFHCHILEHEDAGMMGQFTVG